MDKSKLTELLRYAWLEGRTNGLQNNGKSFSEFLELKEVSEAINYSRCCKSDSERLKALEDLKDFAYDNCQPHNSDRLSEIMERL